MLVINQRVKASTYQQEIIKLQSNFIDVQTKEMQQFRMDLYEDLTETVQETVESSFKSYSDVVKSVGVDSSSPVISQETLKTVAKQVAVEEELSRNIMMFNLPEEEECDDRTVSEVFECLGEKPSFEATRLGKKKDSSVRPVRVVMSSVRTVQTILSKSRKLRQTEKYNTVFLSPDRTVEERARQRELVQQLKKKASEEPQRKHYIKSGKIMSVDRSNLVT